MTYSDSVMHASDHGDEVHEHPSERTYIRVAIILSIVTLTEVIIYYMNSLRPILVPALMILSLGKFVTVVGYFMHLKFDDRRLTGVFVSGMGVALAVFVGLYTLQHFHKVIQFVGDKIAG